MALADEIYTEYADTYGWTNDTESGHTGSGSHRDGSDGVIQAANDIHININACICRNSTDNIQIFTCIVISCINF